MNIPEEVLRLAALEVADEMPSCANCLRDHLPCTYCTDDATRYARAALSAAAPYLMAIGFDEGVDRAASSNLDAEQCKNNNPYRKEAL